MFVKLNNLVINLDKVCYLHYSSWEGSRVYNIAFDNGESCAINKADYELLVSLVLGMSKVNVLNEEE